MRILFVGDVESNILSLYDYITTQKDIDLVIQVGDFGFIMDTSLENLTFRLRSKRKKIISNQSSLKRFPIPVWFIKGRHEDFQNLDTYYLKTKNINWIPQGTIKTIKNKSFAFVGGLFAKTHYYDSPTKYNNVYLKKQDIDAVKEKSFDVLVTYQGPHQLTKKLGNEGCKQFSDLVKFKSPEFHIHGHHHKNYRETYSDTTIIGLGNFDKNQKSTYILDI